MLVGRGHAALEQRELEKRYATQRAPRAGIYAVEFSGPENREEISYLRWHGGTWVNLLVWGIEPTVMRVNGRGKLMLCNAYQSRTGISGRRKARKYMKIVDV